MILRLVFLLFLSLSKSEPLKRIELEEKVPNQTRRILRGQPARSTRPYMVYLRPATLDPAKLDPNWLCGGVILNRRHVLTSAACIENVQNFYVVSGMYKWIPMHVKNNKCIKEGAKKAIAKTVPTDYVFDGFDSNNIRWMVNDIAIVKVEDDFNFKKRVKGCHFVPRSIMFNNKSWEWEKPRTEATIAGWGSQDKYYSDSMEIVNFTTTEFPETVWEKNKKLDVTGPNSPILLEAKVVLISKRNCKKRWPERYHYIIDDHMICAKDGASEGLMSKLCDGPNCKDVMYSYEDEKLEDETSIVEIPADDEVVVHTARRNDTRRAKILEGGFCENDHGGPLVVGRGYRSMVIGVISACQTKDVNRKCHGPFLFTSVYQHRWLIGCVIREEIGGPCKTYMESRKSAVKQFDWSLHPDGPAKSERTASSTR